MKTHLSQNRLFHVILDQATSDERDHCRICVQCGDALRRIQNPIATFRTVMRAWSEGQPVPPVEGLQRKPSGIVRRWAVVAVVSAAALIGVMVHEARRSHPVAVIPIESSPKLKKAMSNSASLSEEELLLRVNAQLSRTVAAPLEPLQALLPTALPTDQKPTGRNP